MIWAGGTFIGTNSIARLDSRSRDLISLQRIDELKRIFRTDRFLDLGATVSLERILSLGDGVLPPGLRQAIVATVPAPARSLATIGGNICVHGEILNLLPWFATIDARLELRRMGGSRFLPAKQFIGPNGDPALEVGELLTRIRVPLGWWNHQMYRRIDGEKDQNTPTISFCGLAEIHKDLIEDMRLSWCFSNMRWFTFPSLDAELIGRRFPLPEKDVSQYAAEIMHKIREEGPPVSPLLEHRLTQLAIWFLTSLPRDRE